VLCPDIGTPTILHDTPVNEGESLTEALLELALPLVLEVPRRDDEHPLHVLAPL